MLSDIDSTLDCSDDENVQNKSSSVKSVRPLLFDRTIGYKTAAGSSRTESQKIKFYSVAVNMKINLPPEHPAKEVRISDLYDDCMNSNIPESEWNNYLRRQLKS